MNFKKLIYIKILVLFFFSFASANAKVVYLDLDFIIKNSIAGKKLYKDLSNSQLNENKKFDKEFQNLKKVETKIISQKKIITTDAYDVKIKEFKNNVEVFNKKRKFYISGFNKKKDFYISELVKQINLILSNYSKKNSITLIMHRKNIIIGKTELDITNDILILVDDTINNIIIK